MLMIKYLFISVWLTLALSGMSYIFWHNELKYSLPTPLPDGYNPARLGAYIDLAGKLPAAGDKPLFIHFFNPECPCSRFNMAHFKSLVRHYGDKISFAIVVLNKDQPSTEREIQSEFDLNVPISFDSSIAGICGVYATPQAVLLDAHRHLYYRGNYNKSRYCTDKNTNYAQMAIDTLLCNNTLPAFAPVAFRSYGCELPTCKK
jgi:hypothetical protein